jgi:flagellar FliL protein
MAEKKTAAKGETAAEDDAAAAGKKKKKLLIIGGAAVAVLVLAGVLAFVFLGGKKDAEPVEAKVEAPPPTLYVPLGEKFTITLSSKDRAHYFVVSISAMTHEEPAVEDLEVHAPLIRARLVGMLGGRDFDALRTEEGKEALRTDVLKTIQDVLQTETGKPGVEQVYFTEFVLQ